MFTPSKARKMEKTILISISKEELQQVVAECLSRALNMGQMNQHSVPDLMSIKEASHFLQKQPQTLYNLCSQRKIPHIKKLGKLYFSRKALISWLNESSYD